MGTVLHKCDYVIFGSKGISSMGFYMTTPGEISLYPLYSVNNLMGYLASSFSIADYLLSPLQNASNYFICMAISFSIANVTRLGSSEIVCP